MTVYLFSFPDSRALGSPRFVAWPEWHHQTPPPATGWIAASSWVLYGVPGIPWLRAHRPVAVIGRTIYLFYVPPDSEETGSSPRTTAGARMSIPAERPGWRELLVLALVIALGVARIVSTYRTFSATFDEPVHLESGIEWLQFGRLTVNPMHPPLSRAFIAAGPYAEGVRWQHASDWKAEGVAELHSQGDYWRTLALARAGVLPFFILAVLATWSLARQIFGRDVALVGAAALSLLPPVLAHAGLATTDMAVAASLPLVVLAGLRWLANPDVETTVELGGAAGLAVLLKFSALVFVPAALVGMLLVKVLIEPREGRRLRDPRRPYISGTIGVILTAFLMLWAGYMFHLGSPASIQLGGSSSARWCRRRWRRCRSCRHRNSGPGSSPCSGTTGSPFPPTSWATWCRGAPWYFFPVALGVKTPLAFLGLAFVGALVSITPPGPTAGGASPFRSPSRSRSWPRP